MSPSGKRRDNQLYSPTQNRRNTDRNDEEYPRFPDEEEQAEGIPRSSIWASLLARSTAADTFKLAVRAPNAEELVLFVFPKRFTVDQAKVLLYSKQRNFAHFVDFV